MQGADSAQSQVLPVGVPCMVQASLGSVAPSDILLHSLCLERSISSNGADLGLSWPQLSPTICPCDLGLACSHTHPAFMLMPLCLGIMHHAKVLVCPHCLTWECTPTPS